MTMNDREGEVSKISSLGDWVVAQAVSLKVRRQRQQALVEGADG